MSRSRFSGAYAAGGTVLVALLCWLATHTPRQPSNVFGPSATTATQGSLPPTLDARRGGLDTIPATVEARALAQAPAPKRHERRSPEEREQYLRAVHAARSKLLAEKFEAEAQDAGWSRGAEVAIQRLYATEELAALRTHVECRSTMCRVTFSYDDDKAGASAVQRLIAKHPWPSSAYTRQDTARRSGTSYVSREGQTLPQPDLKGLSP